MFENLTPGEIWKIQDDIKSNLITYKVGDSVILFLKNKKGYPKILKVGDTGTIKSVELNHIIVDFSPTYGRWIESSRLLKTTFKLPKHLLIGRTHLREIKLKKLLD
jgi:hypothetical protein